MGTKLFGGNFWTKKRVLILVACVRVKMTSIGTRRQVYSVKKSTRTTESLVPLSE